MLFIELLLQPSQQTFPTYRSALTGSNLLLLLGLLLDSLPLKTDGLTNTHPVLDSIVLNTDRPTDQPDYCITMPVYYLSFNCLLIYYKCSRSPCPDLNHSLSNTELCSVAFRGRTSSHLYLFPIRNP